MMHKVELIYKKDLLSQLEASKSRIKDLFHDLLDETRGFQYQITIKILLKKYKGIEIEFSSVYFSSTAKTVINHKFDLDKSFQEILYRNDNWINEGSGWIVEKIHSQYINISTFRPLSGSSYIKLPAELKNPKMGLINIKSNDQKCFLWCHLRHLNPFKTHPGRITKEYKKLINPLDYERIECPVSKNNFDKTEVKNKNFVNVFCYENKLTYLVYISDQRFKNSMYLLIISDKIKLHYVYIKDFNKFMFYSLLAVKKVWWNIKKFV